MDAGPVVLVHGTRTSSSQFDLQVDGLEAAGHRCVAPDLPGHGSRRGEPFTLGSSLETIGGAMRDAGGGRRVHLVGHSLGGMLAIRAAADNPEHLASLVACGASVQPTVLTARAYGMGMTVLDRLPGATPQRTERLLARLMGVEGARAYLRGGRSGTEVIIPAMRAVASLDLLAELRRIDAPVTIMNPRYDQFRFAEKAFARAAPRGRLVVLPYGTHLANLNRAPRFTADLLRVLEQASAEARDPP